MGKAHFHHPRIPRPSKKMIMMSLSQFIQKKAYSFARYVYHCMTASFSESISISLFVQWRRFGSKIFHVMENITTSRSETCARIGRYCFLSYFICASIFLGIRLFSGKCTCIGEAAFNWLH